jgi:hypothetical protein
LPSVSLLDEQLRQTSAKRGCSIASGQEGKTGYFEVPKDDEQAAAGVVSL